MEVRSEQPGSDLELSTALQMDGCAGQSELNICCFQPLFRAITFVTT